LISLFNIIGGSERSERPRRQQKDERSERDSRRSNFLKQPSPSQ
tara:strand:+ start:19574 stop:19705 length:132 start_codon:yes stop_codon:yes gene_type:complete